MAKVELLQDGLLRETRTSGGSQTFTVILPNQDSTLLQVRATDSNGNVRTADLTVAIATVPELQVSGQVQDVLGKGVAGALVQVKGVQATTDETGHYQLQVLTIDTVLQVEASALFGKQPMTALVSAPVPVDSEDVHVEPLVLKAQGRLVRDPIAESQLSYEGSTGFGYNLFGNGYRWDIQSDGGISDGTSDAYDGGQSLTVNGQGFSGVNQGCCAWPAAK